MAEESKKNNNLIEKDLKWYYALRKKRLQEEFLKKGIISKGALSVRGAQVLSEIGPLNLGPKEPSRLSQLVLNKLQEQPLAKEDYYKYRNLIDIERKRPSSVGLAKSFTKRTVTRRVAKKVAVVAVRAGVSLARLIFLNPYVLAAIGIFLCILGLIMFISIVGSSATQATILSNNASQDLILKKPTVGEISKGEMTGLPLTLPSIKDMADVHYP